MKNHVIFTAILTTAFCLLMCACSTQFMQKGYLANAYNNYEGEDYDDTLDYITHLEHTGELSHNTKGEVLFLKALTFEKLERNEEAQGIFKYLVEAFSDTEYGFKAKEKLK